MPEELKVEEVISIYITLREQKEALNDSVKVQLASIAEKMSKLEAWIQAKSDETGVKSFKTDAGTAFLQTSDFASVGDWDAVIEFVKKHDAYDMLTHGVSKKSVREYIDANGSVPSGVNFGSKVGVSFRRPAKKV
jgi:hypothetical protein